MTHCVLDSSSALTWILPDEDDHGGREMARQVAAGGAVVPAIWPAEIANALLMAKRRTRITADECRDALSALAKLPIRIDTRAFGLAWKDILEIADAEGLTAYDASYLEIAVRLGLPLATRDRKLGSAAQNLDVIILG